MLIAILRSGILAARKNVDQNLKASEILNLFTPMVQLHEKVEVVNIKSAIQSDDIDQAIREHLSKLGVDSRIVIRPSGTEDIVRIMVEADQKSLAEKSMTELIDIVKASCKE